MTRTAMARRSASAHPTLLTPAFLAVTLASLAYFTGDGVLIPAVPRYVQGPLGAGDVAVGLVVGAFSLSAFFLRPWAGGLGDRWGRRPLMLLGAGVFTVSVLGYATASSPEALAGLRLLTGAGEAFFFVGALTAVADLAPPQRRGEAMSLASLSLYVGIGMGPLLGEVAIERFGFVAAWTLAAAAGLAAVVVALRVPDTRPADHGPEAGGAAAGHRLIHRAGLLPGLVLLTSILGMAGFLTFIPLYALDVGMDGSRVVLLLFAAIVVGIRSLGARIPDRLGAARATRVAMALSAAGLAVVGAWRTPAGLVAGTAIFATGIALLTPAVMTLAVQGVAPQERGAVIGTTSSFLDLALGLGPATLGLVAAAVGRPGTFLVGAAVAAAGLLLVWRGAATGSGFGVGGLGRRSPLRTDRTRLAMSDDIDQAGTVAAVGQLAVQLLDLLAVPARPGQPPPPSGDPGPQAAAHHDDHEGHAQPPPSTSTPRPPATPGHDHHVLRLHRLQAASIARRHGAGSP